METTALTLTSLPSEPASGIQTRSEAQPSGEFAKVLQSQPAPTEKPSGKNSEGQEEDHLPATGKEISVLLFSSLPVLLPEGKSPLGEKGSATASSGSQNLRNNGAPQILNIPIPAAATRDGAAAVVQKEMSDGGAWPAGPTGETPIPEGGQASSSPAEKARTDSLDPRLWHNPEGREGLGGDLKNSAKGDLANFASEFSVKGKDLFPNELDPSDISRPANPKTGDPSGILAAPMERSATGSSGSQNLRNNGAPQILNIPIPAAATRDGAAAVVQKEMSDGGAWPAGPTGETPIPEGGQASSSPAEKARTDSLDPRLWHNPEGREGLGGDLKNSVKGKDLFPNELDPSDISRPANPKTGDPSGILAAPMERSATGSSGSQNLRNNGAPQILNIPIPAAATRDGAAAVVQKEMSDGGAWPAGPTGETPIPEGGQASSSPAEKARTDSLDPRLWHNPEGREGLGGDLKNSVKGKDLFPNELDPSDISRPANPKTGDPSGILAAPGERSTGPHPAGEVRLEGTPGPRQPQKAEVYEQISQKMVWSLGQNEEKFRLTLDPPHLGTIYMEIQRNKEQIKTTLWAENPNTKQILESNQLSIQKIIESEGFSLESFNVFVEQDLGAFQESRERMRNPEPTNSNLTAKANRELGSGPTTPPLFVGGSGGRLRSIDLLI